jgi:hypothetical protein
MNDFSYSSSVFLNELMRLSTDIIWKNQSEAIANEDPSRSIDVEQYLVARRGIMTFDLIYSFTYSVLISAGLTAAQATAGVNDKRTIPSSVRDTCTKMQINYIINNYEERNNYYRMLHGLPDIGDTEYFYNIKYPDISDSTTPIHLLSLQERYALEDIGYTNELLVVNPSKKYLKHIASKNIDPYISRNAKKFTILWMNSSDYNNLVKDFVDTYDSCRYAIDKVYYTEAFRKDNPYYDNFMAMCILFMTIQMMHYKFLDADITRDFYDLESIKYVYESYGVPFYSTIPMEYHTQIVKNINLLLSYKGSTRVFFELFNLFDFGMMDVYEYYIMKTHKFENGKPVFIKKEDGSYDLPAMYDIKFGKVRLYDNPPMELSDVNNHIEYTTMITPDIYWISDSDLLNKLYTEEYNYLETKYVGIQTVFSMMKVMYEATYYFKILFDNRKTLNTTTVYYNGTSSNVNIFSLVIYLAVLICKKHGYEGNIASILPSVSKVLGYNFKANITTLRNDALKNQYLKNDNILINLLTTMDVNSLSSINTAFAKIQDMQEHLTNKMCDSHDRGEYFAYYELYNTLMYSNLIESVYKKSDGTVAATFSDLLSDIDSVLYVRSTQSDLNIADEISLALSVMKKSCSSLKYIEMADGVDINSVIEYLFKILEFFKSAKSELTGYNVIYTISSRSENKIKILDKLQSYAVVESDDDLINKLQDDLKLCQDIYKEKDALETLNDKIGVKSELSDINSKIQELTDYLSALKNVVLLFREYDNVAVQDYITQIDNVGKLKSSCTFDDKLTLLHSNIVQ